MSARTTPKRASTVRRRSRPASTGRCNGNTPTGLRRWPKHFFQKSRQLCWVDADRFAASDAFVPQEHDLIGEFRVCTGHSMAEFESTALVEAAGGHVHILCLDPSLRTKPRRCASWRCRSGRANLSAHSRLPRRSPSSAEGTAPHPTGPLRIRTSGRRRGTRDRPGRISVSWPTLRGRHMPLPGAPNPAPTVPSPPEGMGAEERPHLRGCVHTVASRSYQPLLYAPLSLNECTG